MEHRNADSSVPTEAASVATAAGVPATSGGMRNEHSQETTGNGAVSDMRKASKLKQKHNPPSARSNCVVLKNLDYKVTHDSLAQVVRHVMPHDRQFLDITLMEDKVTRTFRGVAFVTFASVEDAEVAIEELSKVIINRRKVFTEYRRTRPSDREQPINNRPKKPTVTGNLSKFNTKRTPAAACDSNDRQGAVSNAEHDQAREAEFRALLCNFAKGCVVNDQEELSGIRDLKNDYVGGTDRSASAEDQSGRAALKTISASANGTSDDMVFDASLTSYDRRMVHMLCEELKLGHISRFDEDGNRVLHVTRDCDRAAQWAREDSANFASSSAGQENWRRRNGRHDNSKGNDGDRDGVKLNYYCPRQIASEGHVSNGANGGGGGIRAPTYRVIAPVRQPTGPDGSVGFQRRLKHHGLSDMSKLDVKESKGKGKQRKGEPSSSEDHMENGGDGKGSKGKGKGKHIGKGRKSSSSGLNPFVPAFSPSGS